MSVGWVILGHVYFTRIIDVVYNIEDIPYVLKSPLAAFGYSSTICIDAFLWVGGFVFGFLILEEALKRKGKLSWSLKILGRVLRLLPIYIFIMAFANFVEPSLGEGPIWHKTADILKADCPEY